MYDDEMLIGLEAALEASPDNLQLLVVLARALHERGHTADAVERIADRDPALLRSFDGRLELARICLEGGAPERTLELADGDEPGAMLLRARAHGRLGDPSAGLELYRQAVERRPAFEDPELARELGGQSRAAEGMVERGGLRLVSSQDDEELPDHELSRLLVPETRTIRFADVGGLDAAKKQIHRRIIRPFLKPALYQRFRKRIGGGILFYGPPGCGKTMLAQATAGECSATFFNVAIPDVLDMYIGESERKLNALFEKARASRPAVMFFDEIESLGAKRSYGRDHSAKTVSAFLAEMDGFARNNSGVLVLGATNVPWDVDPAFRRPGRFDRVMFVPPPDREARAAILERLLEERPTADDLKAASLAHATSGFSGADLEHLVETAADEAIEQSIDSGDEVPIGMPHLKAALDELRPTTLEWLTTARNYARYSNEGGQYDEVLEFLRTHGKG